MPLGFALGLSSLFELFSVLQQKLWTGALKDFLDFSTVFQRLFHCGNERQRHVHDFAASCRAKGEEPGSVVITPGTGWAIFPNARFVNLGQRAFDCRPEMANLSFPFLF